MLLGYRFISDELADLGITASENRVWRLCSIAGVFASHHCRRGKAKPGPAVHGDLLAVVDEHGALRHEFSAAAYEVWLTHITEHPTGEGTLYLCDTRRWESREELRLAIVTWIETKHNRRRRQRAVGKLTPVDFELIYAATDAA